MFCIVQHGIFMSHSRGMGIGDIVAGENLCVCYAGGDYGGRIFGRFQQASRAGDVVWA